MSAMIVLKTTREVASSSYLEVDWDISKIDIAVGAADWSTKASLMTLGNLITVEMINIMVGNPTNLIIKAFFIYFTWIFTLERLAFFSQLRRIPTITNAKTITILEGIHSKAVNRSSHGDEWTINAPINPLKAGLLNTALIKPLIRGNWKL